MLKIILWPADSRASMLARATRCLHEGSIVTEINCYPPSKERSRSGSDQDTEEQYKLQLIFGQITLFCGLPCWHVVELIAMRMTFNDPNNFNLGHLVVVINFLNGKTNFQSLTTQLSSLMTKNPGSSITYSSVNEQMRFGIYSCLSVTDQDDAREGDLG